MQHTQKYNLIKTAGVLDQLSTAWEHLSPEDKGLVIGGLSGVPLGAGAGFLASDERDNTLVDTVLGGAAGGIGGAGAGYGIGNFFSGGSRDQQQQTNNSQENSKNPQQQTSSSQKPEANRDVSVNSNVVNTILSEKSDNNESQSEKLTDGGVINPMLQNTPSNINLDPAYSEGITPESDLSFNNAEGVTNHVNGSNANELLLDAKLQAAAQGKSTSEFLMHLIDNADKKIKNTPEDINVMTR